MCMLYVQNWNSVEVMVCNIGYVFPENTPIYYVIINSFLVIMYLYIVT